MRQKNDHQQKYVFEILLSDKNKNATVFLLNDIFFYN